MVGSVTVALHGAADASSFIPVTLVMRTGRLPTHEDRATGSARCKKVCGMFRGRLKEALNKPILDFSEHAKQKAWFLLCFIFNGLPP
ncbi:MAG: hypothetical protein ACT4NU_03025, partial [Chromatiales bacterium]